VANYLISSVDDTCLTFMRTSEFLILACQVYLLAYLLNKSHAICNNECKPACSNVKYLCVFTQNYRVTLNTTLYSDSSILRPCLYLRIYGNWCRDVNANLLTSAFTIRFYFRTYSTFAVVAPMSTTDV